MNQFQNWKKKETQQHSDTGSLNEPISELEKEGNTATQWFRYNSVSFNWEKIHAIISDKKNDPPKLTIKDEKVISSFENLTLLDL